ncbi:O-methyltransferase [Parvibaculum sp.]|uniref:O-methyltransferase n=1 Tax=Parvibaculum sp. TaxID=2024848 RepID=UPI002C9A5CD2|nr:O-methyltransferase [Parvibaculum sp.]HUD51880.1 O-methyltransferase [Parvibaculum sp.]
MSGDNIPYQLRPNKFIDRQIFIDLLTRLIVPRGIEKYVYVSMGGRHLVDHYAIYNHLGIRSQLSFDLDENEVARQKFNRPTGAAKCIPLSSADLPAKIDDILAEFPGKKNVIVWLDYTTADRRSQFQEVVQTLIRLKHGDVFRVTLNANPQTLCGGNEWQGAGSAGPAEFRAEKLKAQIEEFLPTDVLRISDDGLPVVLARSVELAVRNAEAIQPNLRFKPVLVTSYKDGARMLTVTCTVSDVDEGEKFPSKSFTRWNFASRGWTDIQSISAPILSSREQHRLDKHIHSGPKRMLAALGFMPAKNENASLEALRSYSRFHRYYPTFRHVDD